jgi:D-xylonolactonase
MAAGHPEIAWTIVADYRDRCGECPVWDAAEQLLYWTDITGQRCYSYQPSSGEHRVLQSSHQVNGFRPNRDRGFVITNPDGFSLWNGGEQVTSLVAEVDGAKCALNDCAADAKGRVLAGSTFYDPAGVYPLGALFAMDCDGTVRVLDAGFHLSNGIAFSPDNRTLYFTDSVARIVYAYNYDAERGRASRRRVLIKVPNDEGVPDGLCVDSEGFLWSAQWYGSCVVRYDPDGKVERRIRLPAKQISCMTFGGPDLRDLYVTSAAESESMPVMPAGYDPHNGFFGGPVYRVPVDVTGLPALPADIRPRQ